MRETGTSWFPGHRFTCASGVLAVACALSCPSFCLAGDAPLFQELKYVTGSNPQCAIAVDLTGDGHPEIVSGEDGSGNSRIRTFVNNGFGLFTQSANIPSAVAFPTALASADLDGDLDQDVVVAGLSNGAQVAVMLNNGGTLAAGVLYTVGLFPRCLALGDLDDDGDADMVVGNSGTGGTGNTVSILLNNGNGTFAAQIPFTVGSNPSAIIIADIDSDTDPDWIVSHEGSNFVTIGRNNGDATFVRVDVNVGVPSIGLIVNNLDGDSDVDMAILRWGSMQIQVLLNGGGVSFTPQTPLTLSWTPYLLAAADMDNDGDVDLLGVVFAAGRVNVLLNNGSGAFPNEVINPTTGGVSQPSMADMDGDGDLDVVATITAANRVHVMLNRGNADLKATTSWPVDQNTGMTCVADFDNDGDDDVVVGHAPNNGYSLLRNNGNAVFAPYVMQTLPFSPKHVFARHLNNDALPDLIFCCFDHDRVSVVLNTGTGFAAATSYVTGANPIWADAGDIDGDLDNDLVVAQSNGNAVSILINGGAGTFSSGSTLAFTTPQRLALCHIDADSDLDLVVLGNQINISLNDGSGAFTPISPVPGGAASGFGVADYDGDGDNDISALFGAPFGTRTCFNSGAGAFTLGPVIEGFGSTYQWPADMDNDGDIDLALGTSGTHVLINNGAGVWVIAVSYLVIGLPGLAPGDFNGDGHVDLAVPGSDRIMIMLNLANWPLITGDPESQVREPGESCSFGVEDSSLAPLIYQWRKDGQPLSDGGSISGSDTSLLNISAVTASDAGSYDVVVSSFCGQRTSLAATLIVENPCLADIAGNDGQVSVIDLLMVINEWGPCDPPPPAPCPADINDDGHVSVLDLLAVINAWGPCP